MGKWTVTIPIGGHAVVDVEADTEGEAKERALGMVTLSHMESWDTLDPVSRGNVLSFPSPWRIEVEPFDADED